MKRVLLAVALCATLFAPAALAAPDERFRDANAAIHRGDLPAALSIYRELATQRVESPALYWNWSQAAAARGAVGEALWAALRTRELDPGDGAAAREAERLRQAANLDAAELTPEPLAAPARVARRFRLGSVAALLLLLSVAAHALARWRRAERWPVTAAWTLLAAGLAAGAVPVAASFASPTAVVVHRGTALLDAASPGATPVATLREGEVVLVLGQSGAYLRVRDASGASGWVGAGDAWRLDGPPPA